MVLRSLIQWESTVLSIPAKYKFSLQICTFCTCMLSHKSKSWQPPHPPPPTHTHTRTRLSAIPLGQEHHCGLSVYWRSHSHYQMKRISAPVLLRPIWRNASFVFTLHFFCASTSLLLWQCRGFPAGCEWASNSEDHLRNACVFTLHVRPVLEAYPPPPPRPKVVRRNSPKVRFLARLCLHSDAKTVLGNVPDL